MLDRPAQAQRFQASPSTLFLGKLSKIAPQPTVQFSPNGEQQSVAAASLVALSEANIGQAVVLSPLAGNQGYVILGLLHTSQPATTELTSISVNDKKVEICAEEELVLRCGDASIRIDQTGAITVKGKALLSRAEGTNRVQGGAVQIN